MENRLSASQLNTLLSCEAKFAFRYLHEIKVQPSGALTFGSSYDKALNTNYEQKIESKVDMKVSDVQDAFVTEFDRLSPDTDWKEENSEEVKDSGVKVLEATMEEITPLVQPIKVQGEYLQDIDGVMVLGYTDVETETMVIDNKTTSRTPSAVSNDYLIQGTTYKIMTGKPIELHYGIRTKKPGTKILQVDVTEDDINYVKNLYKTGAERKELIMEDMIKVIPNRSHNLCSKKWCGYWQMCELKYGGRVK